MCFLIAVLAARGEPAGSPPPEAPAWQRDLDAARLLEIAADVAPAAKDQETTARRDRLSAIYAQLAQRYPDQLAVQKAAGDYAWKRVDADAALTYWNRAQALDPHDAATASALGSLYLQCGQPREAYAQLQRAVDDPPESAAREFDLATVLGLFRHELVGLPGITGEESALVQALAHYRRAAGLAPGDEHLAQAYAEAFYLLPKPDWETALTAWQTVLSLSGDDTDFANGHLARISLRLGRADQADLYLARIRDPAFDSMKARLQEQSDRLRALAPAPSLSPASTTSPPGLLKR